MLLIGMLDSPFVRRVAITARLYALPFEHANWSVGRDVARIQAHNPLGQVPTLVLEDGEVLIESSAILDHLDELADPERALMPRSGAERRRVMKLTMLAMGVAEKARMQAYEWVFRPPEKGHEPLRLRLRAQMLAAAAELERLAPPAGSERWMAGDRLTQADVTLGCALTFALEAVTLPEAEAALPALRALHARLEALPVFRATYARFEAPRPQA